MTTVTNPGAPSFAGSSQRVGYSRSEPSSSTSLQKPDVVDSVDSPITKKSWHQAQPWHTNLALLLFGTGLIALSIQFVSENDHFAIGFSGASGLSAMIYVASVLLILTQPVDRLTLPIILVVAALCCIAPLVAEPFLSSDIYRYVWDGVVQHAHISPYRYVPGDPALTFLRAPNQELFDNINRRDYAHTIYPPFAQFLFYLITFLSPTVTAMKCVMLLFSAVTVATLITILQNIGLRREQVLLFAWCPLLVWEIAGSGHLDAAAMALITLALLFRLRRQPVLTGLFLGLAVITKLYPIVLLPALLMPRSGSAAQPGAPHLNSERWAAKSLHLLNPANWDWKLPLTTLTAILLGYAAYASAGKLVFGFLGGYIQEEGITTGTRYFLLELAQHIPGLHNLPTAAFYLFCILIFTALTLWSLKIASTQHRLTASNQQPATSLAPAFAFATALMLLFAPHYPWYIAWLVPFFTLQPNLPILTYLMAFFYLFTTQLADGTLANMYTLNERLYGVVAISVIVHFFLRNRTLPALNFHQQSQRPL